MYFNFFKVHLLNFFFLLKKMCCFIRIFIAFQADDYVERFQYFPNSMTLLIVNSKFTILLSSRIRWASCRRLEVDLPLSESLRVYGSCLPSCCLFPAPHDPCAGKQFTIFQTIHLSLCPGSNHSSTCYLSSLPPITIVHGLFSSFSVLFKQHFLASKLKVSLWILYIRAAFRSMSVSSIPFHWRFVCHHLMVLPLLECTIFPSVLSDPL